MAKGAAYGRLARYINAAQGDMSTERRGELVDALTALGYKRAQAVNIVWTTPLNEVDSDEDALRAILVRNITPDGDVPMATGGGAGAGGDTGTPVSLLGGVVTMTPTPPTTGSNIDADTTPIDPGEPTTPPTLSQRISSILGNPRGDRDSQGAPSGNGRITDILEEAQAARGGSGPGPSPDEEGTVTQAQLQRAQAALTQVRTQGADEDEDEDDETPPIHPNAASQFADRWMQGVQPGFDRLAAWADSLPTPGGIGLLLIVIAFFLFAIVPVNGTQTRLSLIFLTLFGHTKLNTPSKPWQAIPNNPIAAGIEGLASATEDIAQEMGVLVGGLSGISGAVKGIGGGIGGSIIPGLLGASGVVGSGMQDYLHGASGGLLDFNYGEDGFLPPAPTSASPTTGGTQTF